MRIAKQIRINNKTKNNFELRTFPSWTLCHLWDNVEKYGRSRQAIDGNIIMRMLISCWISEATDTLRICNYYCFPTTRVVTRTRGNIASRIARLVPCYINACSVYGQDAAAVVHDQQSRGVWCVLCARALHFPLYLTQGWLSCSNWPWADSLSALSHGRFGIVTSLSSSANRDGCDVMCASLYRHCVRYEWEIVSFLRSSHSNRISNFQRQRNKDTGALLCGLLSMF